MVASDHPPFFPCNAIGDETGVKFARSRALDGGNAYFPSSTKHEHTWGRFSPTSRLAARKRQRCQAKRLLKVLLYV